MLGHFLPGDDPALPQLDRFVDAVAAFGDQFEDVCGVVILNVLGLRLVLGCLAAQNFLKGHGVDSFRRWLCLDTGIPGAGLTLVEVVQQSLKAKRSSHAHNGTDAACAFQSP